MFRPLRISLIVVVLAAVCGCIATPVPASATTFANGVDISWLTQLQTLGYSYVDQAKVQTNALTILKNHGVNAVRIRTFVNPTISSTSLGVGDCDQAGSIALAKTANSMGFKIMIDFHYSDTWADAGTQTTPSAWSSYTYSELKTAVYDYTYSFMAALAADGIYPIWVQVGNEINSGMLWPIGKYTNPSQLAGLINSGYSAVKAVSSSSLVVVHLATLSNLADFEWFFDLIKSYGAEWDVIGASYYDGPSALSTITTNMNTLVSRYSKPIMICEIGHTYSDYMGAAYDVKSAIEAVKAVSNSQGLGVFYWVPEAPDDSTTSSYSLGAVSESGKVLQFTPAIDQYLFTGTTTGNQIINPSFSSGTNGWQITTNVTGSVYSTSGGTGTMLRFYDTAAYNSTLWQDVTALPSGTYTMTAYVESSGGETSAIMFAYPTGGSETTVAIPTASTWTKITLTGISITEAEAWVGFTVNAKAGEWVNIESVSFTKQ